jgi:hypothetical protein
MAEPAPEPEPVDVSAMVAAVESQTSQASAEALGRLSALAALAKSGELRDEEFSDGLVRASLSMLQSVLRRALDNLSLGEDQQRFADAAVDPPRSLLPPVPDAVAELAASAAAAPAAAGGRPPLGRGATRRPPKASLSIGSGTPMTVAPWALGGGGGGRGGRRGGRVMTRAPWARGATGRASGLLPGFAQAPPVKMSSAPDVTEPAPSAALRGTEAASRSIAGATDACDFVRCLVSTPECTELVQAGQIEPTTLRHAAAAGSSAARYLGSISTNSTSLLAQVLREGGIDAQLSARLVDSLLGLVHSLYARFIAVRPMVRAAVMDTMLSAAQRLSTLSALSVGARLHEMDGGPRLSGINAAGLISLLEFAGAIARGYRQPLAQRHQNLLWEIALPLHAPENAVDDTTPVLELYHRPLTLWCSDLLRKSPALFPRFIETLVTAHWPTASGSNSSKEVLLLHELELVMEHAPNNVLDEPTVRGKLLDRMVRCIDSAKNFRVAERALLMWKSDGVRNLLSGWIAELLPLFLPALLEGSEGHWNHTVLKLIGVVLRSLEEMAAGNSSGGKEGADEAAAVCGQMFERACLACSTTAEAVRAKADELNPPPDLEALAAARAATEGAIKQRQETTGGFNVYSVALGHELAVGTFSRVRYAKLILRGLKQSLWPEVAVKIQERAVVEAQSYAENVRREIRILETMTGHPAIIRLVGSFETDSAIWVLMDLASGGDLHGVLAARGSLSVASTRFLAAEVLLGVEALHGRAIVYGDLKPENILLDAAGHIKLADFGSARLVDEPPQSAADGSVPPPPVADADAAAVIAPPSDADAAADAAGGPRVEGTAEYVPPEVATGQQLANFSSDAWAYGCVVFQLLAGRPPILSTEEDPAASELAAQRHALEKVVRFAGVDEDLFPEGFDESATELVAQMLSLDPAARLPADAGVGGGVGAGSGSGGWGAVRELAFFSGHVDFDRIFDEDAPALGGGIVSAATAKEKNWNRRKQSMMWAPMPDQYSTADGPALGLVPEESEEEAQAAKEFLARGVIGGGGGGQGATQQVAHQAIDDGTILSIGEGEEEEEEEEGS